MAIDIEENKEQEEVNKLDRTVRRGGFRENVNRGNALVIRNLSTPTASTAGKRGEIRVDSDFIYVYTGSAWKKATLSAL